MKQEPQLLEIDWQRVRRGLAAACAATEAALQLSPERAREVMDARAAALARPPVAPLRAAEMLEVLTFSLGEEHYALETRAIREVQRSPEMTFVPGTPAFVRGVVNLRGEVLAVMDLSELFGLGVPRSDNCPWLIVLGGERPEFGVAGDAVHEVTTIRTDGLHEAPATLSDTARQCARGVTDEAVVVLDAATLLSIQRLFIDSGGE